MLSADDIRFASAVGPRKINGIGLTAAPRSAGRAHDRRPGAGRHGLADRTFRRPCLDAMPLTAVTSGRRYRSEPVASAARRPSSAICTPNATAKAVGDIHGTLHRSGGRPSLQGLCWQNDRHQAALRQFQDRHPRQDHRCADLRCWHHSPCCRRMPETRFARTPAAPARRAHRRSVARRRRRVSG